MVVGMDDQAACRKPSELGGHRGSPGIVPAHEHDDAPPENVEPSSLLLHQQAAPPGERSARQASLSLGHHPQQVVPSLSLSLLVYGFDGCMAALRLWTGESSRDMGALLCFHHSGLLIIEGGGSGCSRSQSAIRWWFGTWM
ncbi:unnamed protein product, partial [Musa acuminata var. zebrina]